MRLRQFALLVVLASSALLPAACQAATLAPPEQVTPDLSQAAATVASPEEGQPISLTVSGSVAVDGSSTVYPITEAVAEEFGKLAPDVRVAVGIAGTGGGFKKLCNGEIDINDASRPIKDEEKAACEAGGVEYVAFHIATDGIAVVANPENDWVECLTVEQLKAMWDEGSTVQSWKDVDPAFPDVPLKLYGPGTDSGTFDFFTETINGEAKRCRPDFTASEDDNTLVQGVAGDRGGLGYFGLAYFLENQDKLRDVAIDGGAGCVNAALDTVADGSYMPLSRPLFIYVSTQALQRPEVRAFVQYYLETADELVSEVGYVAADPTVYEQNLATLAELAR